MGKKVVVAVKGGNRVEADLLTEPDKGGNVKVCIDGEERETNITKLYTYKSNERDQAAVVREVYR